MARRGLLIGVSEFDDNRLAALNAPQSDVEALSAILRDPARGGFDQIAVSINEDFLTLRDRLAALFDGAEPDDTVLLYYSGHGILRRGNRLFLATPGSLLDRPQARSIAASEIRDMMDQCRADSQLLFLDCCHSGAFADNAKGASATAVTNDTFAAGASGRYVITASDNQQFAWDGGEMKEGDAAARRLSSFTSWLVEGLGGKAAPDEPQITMDALFRYAARRARAEGAAATPQSFVSRGTGDLVIARNPAVADGQSVQVLAVQLGSDDWAVRRDAAEALGKLVRRHGTSQAARDALADRLGAERDYKVRGAILKALELREDTDEAPPRRPEPAPEPHPQPPRRPDTTASVAAMPVLLPREIAVLNEAGVRPADWPRLPGVVLERVRLVGRAVTNGRILMWIAWGSVVLDIGAIQQASQHDPSGAAFACAQLVAGVLCLVPTPLRALLRPDAVPAEFGALMARTAVLRLAGKPYERRRVVQAGLIMVIAGVLALFGCLVAASAT
ncbi:MAG TPA: caspase family protein [Acetobacteraceae bacterium]|nr:caspase family protein [Acetobacteraceae bacterium]